MPTQISLKVLPKFPAQVSGSFPITVAKAGQAYTIGIDLAAAFVPAGSDKQVQFNNAGAFGASPNLTWDGTTLLALHSAASGAAAIHGQTSSATTNAKALLGAATSGVGVTFGAYLSNASSTSGAVAVRGDADGGTGDIYGVQGVCASTGPGAAAGYFVNQGGGAAVKLVGALRLASYTVVGLSVIVAEGDVAFATNGRKISEGPGAGTGVPVYFSLGSWRVFSTDAPVLA